MTLIDRLSKLDGPCGTYTATQIANHSPFKGEEWALFIEALKGSVDSAIALAERVLPGWQVNVTRFHEIYSEASVGNIAIAKKYYGSNPAIALCIAILRAKEASNG